MKTEEVDRIRYLEKGNWVVTKLVSLVRVPLERTRRTIPLTPLLSNLFFLRSKEREKERKKNRQFTETQEKQFQTIRTNSNILQTNPETKKKIAKKKKANTEMRLEKQRL